MNGRPWSDADLQLLAELYPHQPTADVARALGRAAGCVYAAANSRGLHKTEAFLASDKAGRIQRGRTDPRMVSTQFKKGQESWTKGLKGVVGVQEACRATQFKKGGKPHTTQPVGSYRQRRESTGALVLELKVSEMPGPNHLRWTPVARLVWEREHGPVPAGHIVVFKPGMSTIVLEEITPDRVECITRAEHARRNHPRNKSPELAKLVQLKGAITRQVNRIAREAQE